MAGTTRAKRQLHSYGRSEGNWRLKGLFLAGLPTTKVTPEDVAKAWPTHKSDYRFLSDGHRNHRSYGPDHHLTLEEESEGYRRLSDATDKSDWSDGPMDTKTIHTDRAIKRALAFGSTTEEFNTLWREQLMDTVIEGARKRQIARDAANVVNVETKSGDHPRGQGPAFARDVAEGGAIRDDREDNDTVEWSTQKFGEGARATEELIDHALVDVIERNVEWLGRSCENKINRIWLTELIDNADSGNDVDTSAESNRDLASVNAGVTEVELSDFQPDTIVTHPRYIQTLGESDNLIRANEAGTDDGLRDRVFFPLFGLEGIRGSNGVYDPDGANTWDFQNADEYGAVVYQRDHINLYMYRDIEIKDYEDPIRDLEGVNARAQVDATYAQPSAASRLQY